MFRTIAKAAVLAAALGTSAGAAERAVAQLKGPDGSEHGRVVFKQANGGVLVEVDANNLPKGGHGFHIHETGACTPDFGAAGGHYNPAGKDHGLTNENGFHAGDMPNIYVDGQGNVRADIYWTGVSMEDGAENTLFDDDGSAVIVHTNPDSYGPDAGAGDRIACGVISAE